MEVATDEAVSLPKGQFYWHQVIGLRVEDATTQELLGEITDILETGANDVLVVRGKRERLIPFIASVVLEVDLAGGRVVVDWGADY